MVSSVVKEDYGENKCSMSSWLPLDLPSSPIRLLCAHCGPSLLVQLLLDI
jgi:hypothetical protein